jgi:hypothetical protein
VATFGRRSALLSLGALQSIEEVDRVAGEELSGAFARYREQMTVEHRPATVVERPYVGYLPGSDVTAPDMDGTPTVYPVVGLSISEDVDGQIEVVPTIGDIIVGIDEIQEHLISNTPRRTLPPGWNTPTDLRSRLFP